jgi:hypothetical protein
VSDDHAAEACIFAGLVFEKDDDLAFAGAGVEGDAE